MPRAASAVILSLLSLAPALVSSARADSLHCESQVQSGGHLAVEERGYEIFIEPAGRGQSTLRLRLTYFNSSSQPMDLVSRVALPSHSQIKGVAVRGDHGWIAGAPTHLSKEPSQTQGVFARILDGHQSRLTIAELVGINMPAQTYTAIELQLQVPVQRWMKQERLCLPPRMVQGAGLVQQRRVSLRDEHGKGLRFFVDGQAQESQGATLRSNDRNCVSWAAQQGARSALQVQVASFFTQGKENRFSVSLALGSENTRPPSRVSVMLDNSSSVERSTFARGAKLYYAMQRNLLKRGELWSFDRRARRIASAKGLLSHQAKAGSDLVQALSDWLDQGGARNGPETLVVITDGLLPLPGQERRLQALEKKLRRNKNASIILLIDDPILAMQGVGSDHPLLTLAAKTSARLSLRSLADFWSASDSLDNQALQELFASPKVAQHTKLRLPRGCVLDTPAPKQLIAGQAQLLRGHCSPKVKHLWVQVQSTLGSRKRKARTPSRRLGITQSHWASATSPSQRDAAQNAGYAWPSWFRRSMQREADLSFEAASQIRERRGHLDAELVQHRLREHLWPRAHACYNHALSRNRAQAGVAELAIALGKGEVSLVQARSKSLKIQDPELLACLEKAAWKIRVPAGLADPVVYRVYYPLKFSRPKNADVGEISGEDRLRYEWLLGREMR